MSTRRRIWLQVVPGIAERAVVIGPSLFPWLAKVVSRGAGARKCWRGLAHRRDFMERDA